MSRTFHRIAVLSLLMLFAGSVSVFPQKLFEIAKVSLKNKEVELSPEGKGTVTVQMNVKDGWWSYGTGAMDVGPQPTVFAIISQSPVKVAGTAKVSKTKKEYDPNFEVDVEKVFGKVELYVPLSVAKTTKAGKYDVAMEVYYMACNTKSCLPPDADTLRFTVVVPEHTGTEEEQSLGEASQDTAAAAVAAVDADTGATTAGVVEEPTTPGADAVTADADAGAQQAEQTVDSASAENSGGLWGYFWVALGHGAVALLTPCVFPMIPITVSFFTKRAEKQNNKWHGIRDSLIYSLGIIFTFTGIGIVVAAVVGGSGVGDFAANPWVNLALAAIFFLLALNLFGVFEIRVPSSILNKLNARSSSGNGITSVLLMGVVFTLTSFTCTVPFVGSALGQASRSEFAYPIVGMLGFSLAFAAPFFLLALFPTAMAALPKAGGWMNNIKVVMGFLEVAFALKFISNVDLVWAWGILPRDMFLSLWIACSTLIVLYILGLYHLPHDSKVQSVGAPRILFAIAFAGITFYLLSGLYGRPLGELDAFLPPHNYDQLMNTASSGSGTASATPVVAAASVAGTPGTGTAPGAKAGAAGHDNWIMSYEEGLQLAKKTGKPVFIDFTGFTCTNCRWMEANVFPQADVQALMNDMVKVQLYTDRREEPYISNKKLKEGRFNSLDLPLYVLLTPDGEFIASKAFTRDKQEFIDFLKEAG